MTDYSAVAPPQTLSGNFDPSSAFADALQRARQIAAKINTPNSDSNNTVVASTKRPLEDSTEQNVPKKMAALNDPIGAQLAAMQQQQRLGMPSNAILTEEFHVPDKMVGLIIGRGGEQITRLQAESACKIQMAAVFQLDSGGLPDRSCSLTGTKQAIEKAKEMILDIVNRGTSSTLEPAGSQLSDGTTTVEMMIPSSKVGLIIGKGGETIKNLQERAGVKMVMIQDGMFANSPDKPLRIKGDSQKAEYARQLIMDLLTERELENMNRGFNRNQAPTNDYGTGQGGMQEVAVPRQAVGVVIGKGGEMIKKIQQDSGARVQFQQDDGPGDRMCLLTGTPEQVSQAQSIIHELINSVLARDQQNMGRGRGRGRGFDDRRGGGGGGAGRGGSGDFMPGNQGMGRGGPPNRGMPDWVEITYSVPANKCGIVIGKGGETIRTINQQTGAHVELSRNPSANPNEKLFVIRGVPGQIEHAKQLINEKIGGGPPVGPGAPQGAYGMPPGGPQPPQGAPGYPQNNSHPPQPHQPYAPQGWGGAYQHWQGQPAAGGAAAGSDPNKQSADIAAQWAAYYAQYYGQPQQTAQPAPNPPAAQGQPAAAGQVPATQTARTGQTAQPDYSAAWADYYRSMGMFQEADMIEQQARANQQNTGQQQGTAQPAAATTPAATTQPSQPPAQTAQPAQQPSPQSQQQYAQYGQQYAQYTQQQGGYPYNYGAYPQPQ